MGAALTTYAASNLTHVALADDHPVPEDVLELIDTQDINVKMLSKITVGYSVYYIIGLSSDVYDVGEPVVIRRSRNQNPVVLKDFIGVPQAVAASAYDIISSNLDLQAFALDPADAVADLVPQNSIQKATQAQDERVLEYAVSNVGKLKSDRALGTGGGVYACAWAVNQIVALALRKPIANTLSTSVLGSVLAARHVRVETPVKGCIVISPTVDRRVEKQNRSVHVVGHVGIVGEDNSIYSNSSRHRVWMKNWTLAKWEGYFGRKGLDVNYYRLDDIYFPKISAGAEQ